MCYYHIELTVKYRKALLDESATGDCGNAGGFKERYAVEPSTAGFDRDHTHVLCRYLPKYSGGQVNWTTKSIITHQIFVQVPEIKKALRGS